MSQLRPCFRPAIYLTHPLGVKWHSRIHSNTGCGFLHTVPVSGNGITGHPLVEAKYFVFPFPSLPTPTYQQMPLDVHTRSSSPPTYSKPQPSCVPSLWDLLSGLTAPNSLAVSQKKKLQSDLGIVYIPIIQTLGRLGQKELEFEVWFDYTEFWVHHSSTLIRKKDGREGGRREESKEGINEEDMGKGGKVENEKGGERREGGGRQIENIEMKNPKSDHDFLPCKFLHYSHPCILV